MTTINLYDFTGIRPKLIHKLEVEAEGWQLSPLLVDQEGQYWVRFLDRPLIGESDYKLMEPVSIDTRGKMGGS